jgi:predicted esterase
MEEKNNITAVEWLVDYLKNIKELPFIRQNLNMNEQNILDDIIEQAKEMEKEQKKKFFKVGFSQGFASDIISYHKLDDEKEKLFEQYYNETFKKE